MVVISGGLSGGISSAIAGGNFWDGFKQGIITAGLNHVAHIVADGFDRSNFEKLKKQVEKIVGKDNAFSKFSGRKEDLLRLINEVPILNELIMKNKQGTVIWFKIKNIGKDINNPTHAVATAIGGGNSTIEIWWDTADTWIGVAVTLGHEIIHTINESMGMHSMWKSYVNPEHAQDYARANSEVMAYAWEASYSNSGSDYRFRILESQKWLDEVNSIYKVYGKH